MLKELFRRSVWLTIGSVIGRTVPLAVLVWSSRHFEPGQFASVSAGYAWAGIAMGLTSTGEATVMTQRMGGLTDRQLRAALFLRHGSRALALSLVLATFACIAGPAGARALFGSALDVHIVVPAALTGVLWSQVALCVACMNGSHASRSAAGTMALCGVLQGSAMLVALVWQGSATAMVWGLVCGSAAALAAAAWRVRGTVGTLIQGARVAAARLQQHLGQRRLFDNPVLWNTLASASVVPVTFLASSLIAKGPGGTVQVAQFFALEQVHQVLVYIPAVIGQALLPLVSKRLADEGGEFNSSSFMHSMARLILVFTAVGACVAGLLGLFAVKFVQLLGNPALTTGDANAVRIMFLNAGLALSLSLLGGAFVGSGRIVVAALMNLMWGGLLIVLTAVWAHQGNLGLQAARLVASAALIGGALVLLSRLPRPSLGSGGAPPI